MGEKALILPVSSSWYTQEYSTGFFYKHFPNQQEMVLQYVQFWQALKTS